MSEEFSVSTHQSLGPNGLLSADVMKLPPPPPCLFKSAACFYDADHSGSIASVKWFYFLKFRLLSQSCWFAALVSKWPGASTPFTLNLCQK